MISKNQIDNIPLQSIDQCDRILTQRCSSTEPHLIRESPSDLLIGVSPDTKNNPQSYYTPQTEKKYLSTNDKENLVQQSPNNEIIITHGFQTLAFPIQDGTNLYQLSKGCQNNFVDSKNQQKYNKFILIIDCFTCLVSLIIMFISYVEYRIYSSLQYQNEVLTKGQFQHNYTTIQLRYAIIILSAILTLLIIAKFCLMKKINDQALIMNQTIENYTRYEKKATFILLFEILFNMMILPNGFDVLIEGRSLGGTYTYSLDTIFTIINILKSYHVFNLAFQYASSFEFFNFHISFLFKAAFHKRPFLYTTILFVFTCLISTFLLQIVEITYKKDGSTTQYDYTNLYNSFWVMINTLLTVGFGDGYPYTHLGRGIGIFLAILGSAFIGILVVVFNKVSIPSESERLIQQDIHIEKFKSVAALFIICYHKYLKKQSFENYVLLQLSKEKYQKIRNDPFLQSYFDSIKARSTQQNILFKYQQVKDMIKDLQNQHSGVSLQKKFNKIIEIQSIILSQFQLYKPCQQNESLNEIISYKQKIDQ
ncbi:cation channel family transporter (macronuclear) [Tetrahymena thermophila SB210]|uniref:Cation channel family transporter n=1 Tax=Tetrahymena thermophila (strain SB210) TaxID=312017 RepID=I7M2Y0_TETTS|nr:cation channel family transporter [Tetrahymena thermophila SB210]EAS01602.3 cation channel family transporter [Tetrahymena thermophila SB210]|eukprot:XP_001021847.3 cation channel family transporter [Tetrahymena thermophila SB210]